MTASRCRCKSRTGTQKRRFTTRHGAHRWAITTGRAHNTHIYQCPTVRGVWHITRRRKP